MFRLLGRMGVGSGGGAPDADALDLTGLLAEWGQGDRQALQRIVTLIYKELRRLARRSLRNERPDNSIESAVLVHEAYLRLLELKDVQWRSRAQFYAIAAQIMRHILVDHARQERALKRGGKSPKLELNPALAAVPCRNIDLIELDEALKKLAALDPQQSRMVELRFFGGLSVEETAEVLGVSPRTVKRDWQAAKAFLFDAITRGGHDA